MNEAATTEAAGGRAPADHELSALRWGWGEAYRIGADPERGWWARRRDDIGGDITADGPGELWAAVLADYALKPVPRDLAGSTGTGDGEDDDLPPGRVLRDSDSGDPS